MDIEFEAKILGIDVKDLQAKLKKLGAKKLLERNMRRYVYDIESNNPNKWLRLRDDGEKVTLTIKNIIDDKRVDGTQEAEVVVEDFDMANLILNNLGFVAKSYQENKRISYLLKGCHIEIDFWPRIPAYAEVEGKSAAAVEKIVNLLGFKMEQATSINTYDVYMRYGIDIHSLKELKF